VATPAEEILPRSFCRGSSTAVYHSSQAALNSRTIGGGESPIEVAEPTRMARWGRLDAIRLPA
jgi:hypothetical protein